MSISHHEMLPAQALELAASLQGYRESVHALVRDPRDTALQEAVRGQVRRMGEIAAMLPPMWVPWGEFAVLHFKLVSPRWRIPGVDTTPLASIASDHEAALVRLQAKCVEWAAAQKAASEQAAARPPAPPTGAA